jgi:hypothetical protein
MTYYPLCRQADKVIGLSPHTDESQDAGGLLWVNPIGDPCDPARLAWIVG